MFRRLSIRAHPERLFVSTYVARVGPARNEPQMGVRRIVSYEEWLKARKAKRPAASATPGRGWPRDGHGKRETNARLFRITFKSEPAPRLSRNDALWRHVHVRLAELFSQQRVPGVAT
jgi:hypothetical protein